MSDEDVPIPCKHADIGALQESEKNYCTGGFRNKSLLLEGGWEPALVKEDLPFYIISRKKRR